MQDDPNTLLLRSFEGVVANASSLGLDIWKATWNDSMNGVLLFDLAQICGSNKEGLKRSSQDDISSIQWGWEKPSIDLKVLFFSHTKAVTQPQITKKSAAFCYDFPKKTGSSRQWCPAVCAWFHALKMPTWLRNFSCVSIQLGERWMIFHLFSIYFHVHRAIHSAHFGGVENTKIHI